MREHYALRGVLAPMSLHGHGPTDHRDDAARPVRLIALAVGAVFLLVGVLGFVPGITTGADQIAFAGVSSEAMLLGVFHVSVLHNVVHLLFGVAGIAASRSARSSVAYLVIGGIVYLVLWVYGLVAVDHHSANVVPLNDADNWLHLALGVGMLGLGAWGRRAWRGHALPDTA